jgi:hypothetical protein
MSKDPNQTDKIYKQNQSSILPSIMPRLIGKTSNTPAYTLIAFLAIVGAATTLEFAGAIDLVPDFGRDNPSMRIQNIQNSNSKIESNNSNL